MNCLLAVSYAALMHWAESMYFSQGDSRVSGLHFISHATLCPGASEFATRSPALPLLVNA